MPDNENTPLINKPDVTSSDVYTHFCLLTGIPSKDTPQNTQHPAPKRSLYTRALKKRRAQHVTYSFTAALSNTLLLSQVVLGATLTALGASDASHILITGFGVANTIIAGLVAYLKSRGQPMRARMFRDDLEHVVDEIENSRTMWLGVKHNAHGYDELDLDDKVSVRSEVARLTKLYEEAVEKYGKNTPEMYTGGGPAAEWKGLKGRPPPPGAASGHAKEEEQSPATDVVISRRGSEDRKKKGSVKSEGKGGLSGAKADEGKGGSAGGKADEGKGKVESSGAKADDGKGKGVGESGPAAKENGEASGQNAAGNGSPDSGNEKDASKV